MRVGFGYDVHRLADDRPLIIGGVEIPYEKGLLGHSDADVLTHAIIDSLFGAAAMGDIGTHFPDTDMKYKGACSIDLLKHCCRIVREQGYEISNIDTVTVAQAPKLAPYVADIRRSIANAANLNETQVSIKAKTEEKLGFTGDGSGIKADSVALIEKVQ